MKILFITSTRIGDAVLSSGLLADLAVRYPSARITVACGPAAAPLFAAAPRVERIIVMHKGHISAEFGPDATKEQIMAASGESVAA